MATSSEPDPNLIKAIGLLHSDDPQSATEIRIMLDELIKQRYGPSKMLVHMMTKRHIELEKSFPGMAKNPPEETVTETTTATDDVINLTNSPVKTISDSPDTIADSDDGAMLTMATSEEVENLKEFGDLNCCVCGEMMFTATNRLIECSQCGSLYHQDCHKPTITNEETTDGQEHTWQCNNCNDKPSTSKAAAAAAAAATSVPAAAAAAIEEPISLIAKTKSSASSSRSSSSSNSSSPFYKQDHSSSSSGKHHKSSSSSSKSHKEERSASSSSSSKPTITPSINIISAPDKSSSSTSSKTKSGSSHSSSSKSKSSSSSSSKHHESSSSKRKLSK